LVGVLNALELAHGVQFLYRNGSVFSGLGGFYARLFDFFDCVTVSQKPVE
jgi:hypothetical protein